MSNLKLTSAQFCDAQARSQSTARVHSTPQRVPPHLRDRHARGLRAAPLRVFKCENSGRCALWLGSARLHGSASCRLFSHINAASCRSQPVRPELPTDHFLIYTHTHWTAQQSIKPTEPAGRNPPSAFQPIAALLIRTMWPIRVQLLHPGRDILRQSLFHLTAS